MAQVDVGLPIPLGNYSYLPPVQTGMNDAEEEKAMNPLLAWLASQAVDVAAEETGVKPVLRERGAGLLNLLGIGDAQAAESPVPPPVQTGFQPTTSVVAQDVTPAHRSAMNYVPDDQIPMEGRRLPTREQILIRQDWEGPGRGLAQGDTLPDGTMPVNMDGVRELPPITQWAMADSTPPATDREVDKAIKEAPKDSMLGRLWDSTLGDEEWRLRKAMILNSMRLNPDAALTQAFASRIKDLRETRRENRTADALQQRGLITQQQADLIRMGIPYKDAIGAGEQFDIGSGSSFAEQFGITGLEPAKPYKRNRLTGEVSQIGGAGTNVDINMKAETAYAEEVRKGFAEDERKLYQTAISAPAQLEKMYETRSLIEQGDPQTGAFAELSKNIQRVRSKLFDSETAQIKVADTELLNSLLGSDVFGMIGALGIGARGLDTPAEREFLREVMTGTISLNKETLLRMLDIRENVQRRAIQSYNDAVTSGELDDFFEASGKKKRTIDIPQYSPRPIFSQRQEQEIQSGGSQRIGNTIIRQVGQ